MTEEKLRNLAAEFVSWLDRPVGFRAGSKACLLLIHVSGPDVAMQRGGWLEQVLSGLQGRSRESWWRFSQGLAETRHYLTFRPPGVRTLAACSLWEELVGKLPIDMQHQARAAVEHLSP